MFIIGDTHGLRPIFQIIDKYKFSGENLIHVGDFGLGFETIGRDVKNLELLDEALLETNNHLYVIRGNHDNPIFWDKSKGLYLPKFHNLHLVDDYTVLKIEGKNVLFIGGAISIDRIRRRMDKPPSWWKDEEFIYDEKKLKQAISFVNTIDLVITHTAPDYCYPYDDNVSIVNHYHELEKKEGISLKELLKYERANISKVHQTLHTYGKLPKHWFYGHFHSTKQQKIAGIEFKLMDVNEIYKLE